MHTIEYKISSRWRDNLEETANTIIEEHIEKINKAATINSKKGFEGRPYEVESQYSRCNPAGIFGTKKKILTSMTINFE